MSNRGWGGPLRRAAILISAVTAFTLVAAACIGRSVIGGYVVTQSGRATVTTQTASANAYIVATAALCKAGRDYQAAPVGSARDSARTCSESFVRSSTPRVIRRAPTPAPKSSSGTSRAWAPASHS